VEIGVRLALGADPSSIIALVLRRVAWLVGTGIIIGAGLSFWASHFVTKLLFNLDPRDPITFVTAAVVLMAVGLLAGWLPARRAGRIDPVQVLRS
jgi:ABC-type antimicrobial peptide transport system permease subunit